MGLYSGVGIVCQPLIGPWIDAIGKKPFMLLGVALLAVSALLALTAPAVGLLALVRALQGLAYSAFFVANFSYVIDLIPPSRRGWALGIYGVSGLASTAVAPLVGEWVIRRFGFRPLFGFAIVLAIAAGVLVLPTRERPRTDLPPVQGGNHCAKASAACGSGRWCSGSSSVSGAARCSRSCRRSRRASASARSPSSTRRTPAPRWSCASPAAASSTLADGAP